MKTDKKSSERTRDIDCAIAVVATLRKPGERFTYKQIGSAVGCSWQNIRLIERKALRKVRHRFRRELGLDFDEFLQTKVIDHL